MALPIPPNFLSLPGISALFNATVTFQAATSGTYGNVSGLTSIACHLEGVTGSTDHAWALAVDGSHIIRLRGLYETVALNMRAVIGGDNYMVCGVRHRAGVLTAVAVRATTQNG